GPAVPGPRAETPFDELQGDPGSKISGQKAAGGGPSADGLSGRDGNIRGGAKRESRSLAESAQRPETGAPANFNALRPKRSRQETTPQGGSHVQIESRAR